jgi:hypothetical protein
LLLLDDGGNISDQQGESWMLMSQPARMESLPAKYNLMIDFADVWWPDWDAIVVWDDDDIYLPHHVSAHAIALADHEWSHPLQVYSTYGIEPGEPLRIEPAAGRFHGSLAVRTDLIDRIGGWIDTRRADFDQQQIAICQDLAEDPGRPDAELPPSYIFRWGDTGAGHCQGLMTSAANEDWYERNERVMLPSVGELTPQFDAPAARVVASYI